VKDNEMGRACSTNGANGNIYKILVGNLEGKHHEDDHDIGGWTILKYILDKMGWHVLDGSGSG
jgi:hypothetical protein